MMQHALESLVRVFVNQEDSSFNDALALSSSILSSRFSPHSVNDLSHTTTLVLRHAAKSSTPTTTTRIPFLIQKLASSPLKLKSQVLLFLLACATNSDQHQSPNFPLPKLLSNPTLITPPNIAPTPPNISPNHIPIPAEPPSSNLFNSYYLPPNENTTPTNTNTQTTTESIIIKSIIFVFQGVDAPLIKFDKNIDTYLLDPSITIPNPTRDLVNRLAEVGWLYRKINMNLNSMLQSQNIGLYEQSFCATIKTELIDYYRLIAILESQISDSPSSPQNNHHTSFFAGGITLRRIYIWIQAPLERLRTISVIMQVAKGCKGSALLSVVHQYVHHGDPTVHDYIQRLLVEISRPFYRMLKRWIYKGELQDPYNEFFVSVDTTASDTNLWRSKYTVAYDAVPSFISKALANKIFLIGKSLNFVRFSCCDAAFTLKWSGQFDDLQYGNLRKLEFSIDSAYNETSKHLLTILFEKYKLIDHLSALKRYVFLGQGDFVQYLLDALGPSLCQPASTLYRHNLTGTLEAAVRSSNAQFDDADILRRLDVRLLEATPGDTGWDVFTLDYHVESPINTVLTPQSMHTYFKLFTFLWRLKRVEHALSTRWAKQISAKQKPPSHQHQQQQPLSLASRIAHEMHRCHILTTEMIHFVNQLQHYVLFEVIECSWGVLVESLQSARDLEAVCTAHAAYLDSIAQKACMAVLPGSTSDSKGTTTTDASDPRAHPSSSSSSSSPLSTRLYAIFDTVLLFEGVQECVFGIAAEVDALGHAETDTAYKTDLETRYGLQGLLTTSTNTSSNPSSSSSSRHVQHKIDSVKGNIDDAMDTFKRQVSELLGGLGMHNDVNLKMLGTRLDFNEYYSRGG